MPDQAAKHVPTQAGNPAHLHIICNVCMVLWPCPHVRGVATTAATVRRRSPWKSGWVAVYKSGRCVECGETKCGETKEVNADGICAGCWVRARA